MCKTRLILPTHPDFFKILATPPPGWRNHKTDDTIHFLPSPKSGIFRPANLKEVEEFYLSEEKDEYDAWVDEINQVEICG